jgi:hypothetical protein
MPVEIVFGGGKFISNSVGTTTVPLAVDEGITEVQ